MSKARVFFLIRRLIIVITQIIIYRHIPWKFTIVNTFFFIRKIYIFLLSNKQTYFVSYIIYVYYYKYWKKGRGGGSIPRTTLHRMIAHCHSLARSLSDFFSLIHSISRRYIGDDRRTVGFGDYITLKSFCFYFYFSHRIFSSLCIPLKSRTTRIFFFLRSRRQIDCTSSSSSSLKRYDENPVLSRLCASVDVTVIDMWHLHSPRGRRKI